LRSAARETTTRRRSSENSTTLKSIDYKLTKWFGGLPSVSDDKIQSANVRSRLVNAIRGLRAELNTGVDIVVNTTSLISIQIGHKLNMGAIIPLLTVQNLVIVQAEIDDSSPAAHHKVKDLKLPPDTILIAALREEEAVALTGLTGEEKRERLAAHLLPLAELLPDLAVIDVDPPLAERLRNGYQPDGEVLTRYHIPFLVAGDVIKITVHDKHLVAVARMLCASDELASRGEKRQAVKILRVLNDGAGSRRP